MKKIIVALIMIFAISCSKDIPSSELKTEYSTENVWFKLPPEPDTSNNYYVVIDLYSNHVAECSFLIKINEIWEKYVYRINSDGSYASYMFKTLPMYQGWAIPQHDITVYNHDYPTTFIK